MNGYVPIAFPGKCENMWIYRIADFFRQKLGKAHLELLVAACNNFEKIFMVHKFHGSPKFAKNASSLKIKAYTVYSPLCGTYVT